MGATVIALADVRVQRRRRHAARLDAWICEYEREAHRVRAILEGGVFLSGPRKGQPFDEANIERHRRHLARMECKRDRARAEREGAA